MKLPVKLAATVLGLGMLSAGVLGAGAQSTSMLTTGAHAASAVVHQAPMRSAQAVRAQDAASGAESSDTENATSDTVADTDNIQSGDQVEDTGTDGAVTPHSPATSANASGKVTLLRAQSAADTQSSASEQASSESAAETSTTTETDGIVCDQQGQNEGDNAGC